jgi:hypothetical protein
LTLPCGAHHQLLHEHRGLRISGEAPARLRFELGERWRSIPAEQLKARLEAARPRGREPEKERLAS